MAQGVTAWQRRPIKFECRGISTLSPDRMPAGKYPYLKNVRQYSAGQIQMRPTAQTALNIAPIADSYIHTLEVVDDPLPAANPASVLLVGAGTKLYTVPFPAGGPPTEIDDGFSGYAVSVVPWRPSASPAPWAYVSDNARSRKVAPDGSNYQVGIVPPAKAPAAVIGAPVAHVIDPFSSAAGWSNSGSAGAPTQSARLSTTIASILQYKASGTGAWYAIALAAYPFAAAIQAGDVAIIGSETVTIARVFNQSGVNTTILAIVYDAGTTGLCTVQLTDAAAELEPGSIIDIAGEMVVVTEVDEGNQGDGVQTFRCSTTATHAAGQSVGGSITLLAYCGSAHVAGDTFVVNQLAFQVTAGIGAIYKPGAVNLNEVGGRQVQPSDYITVALNIDAPENLTQGQIGFGLSATSFSATPNVNYLSAQFNAGDLYPQVGGQWYLLQVPVAALVPVGLLPGFNLTNVAVIGVSIECSGTVNVGVGSLWIGGTYGPLVSAGGEPYEYCATYYASATGAESNPSPATRVAVSPQNDEVLLSIALSPDTQADKVRFYRRGGSVATWNRLGDGETVGGVSTFSDVYNDQFAAAQPILVQDNYVPFPVADKPRSGTCSIAGTRVAWVSGDTFNTTWIPGTVITIDGKIYEFYGSPSSTTALEILQSGGINAGPVPFTIDSPVMQGVPMASLWGPFNGTTMFGCGDVNNPGVLYWTQGNNPDAAGTDTNIEVTAPSEPLIAGCMFNGRAYVFSSRRQFLITPSASPNAQGQITYQVQDVPGSLGLLSRTALCVADRIYFLGPDGIYASVGTMPESLTKADLRILFPHEGVAGQSVTVGPDTIYAPDVTNPLLCRLAWHDNMLYFDYYSGGARSMTLDLIAGAWFVDDYAGGVRAGVHYGEPGVRSVSSGEADIGLLIGGGDGNVYVAGSSSGQDNGHTPECVLASASFDEGSPRSRKYYADYGFRADPANATTGIAVQPYFDLYAASAPAKVFGAGQAGIHYYTADILGDGPNGVGQFARDVAVRVSWTETGAVQILDWEGAWNPQPDETLARGEYINVLGTADDKWMQGLRIEIDTGGVEKTYRVYGDGVLQTSFSVTANGQQMIPVSWVPFVAREVQLQGDQTVLAKPFNVTWVYDVLPPLASNWTTENWSLGIPGYKISRYLYCRMISTADVTLTVTADGQVFNYTFASTASADKVQYVPLKAVKAKLWQFAFTSSAPFRLFRDSCEFHCKGVNDGRLMILKPFGAPSNRAGAAI